MKYFKFLAIVFALCIAQAAPANAVDVRACKSPEEFSKAAAEVRAIQKKIDKIYAETRDWDRAYKEGGWFTPLKAKCQYLPQKTLILVESRPFAGFFCVKAEGWKSCLWTPSALFKRAWRMTKDPKVWVYKIRPAN